MNDPTQQDAINEALIRFLGSSWPKETGQKIAEVYGDEVATVAEAVYRAAMDCPVDWYKETMDTALGVLADFLTSEYPWLAPEARTQLNFCFMMTWK